MPNKFQGLDAKGFGGSKKDRYFLKILKWQYKSARKKVVKIVFLFFK